MFGKAAVLAPFVFWRTSLCPKKTLEPPCIIAGFFWDHQHHQFQLVMEQVLRPWPRYPQRSRWYCHAWKPGWLRWQGLIQIGWIFVYAYASCVYLQYVYGVYSIRKICFAVAAFQNVLYKISWSIYIHRLYKVISNNSTLHYLDESTYFISYPLELQFFHNIFDWMIFSLATHRMPHDEAMKRLWLQLHFSTENSDETSKRTKGVLVGPERSWEMMSRALEVLKNRL